MLEEKSLTERTLKRLRTLARGNHIDPQKIEIIESVEKVYTLTAQIKLNPTFDVKIRKDFGRPRTKNHKLLPSFAALQEEIEKQRESLNQKGDWLELALKELEKAKGHGWGHHGATLFWDKEKTLLTAHENCPTCRGSAQSPCPACQGLGVTHCIYCDGRGQETCPTCNGQGQDPSNPGNRCPQCNGNRFVPCRYCRATGRMPCEQCGGAGHLDCPDCQGTGFLSQEAQLKKCATISFHLGTTKDLPSGLLRLLQRIGEDNLPRHADITMAQANPETETASTVKLVAQIPYADIKIKIDGTPRMIAVFGQKAYLAGIPAFLDNSLKEARDLLLQAANGKGKIGKALETRVLQDALNLTLRGKIHPNELRRCYPIGLSATAAKEIMQNMGLALRSQTRKIRLVVAMSFLGAATLFFASLFFTSLFAKISAGWAPFTLLSVVFLLPFVTVGLCWFILINTTQWTLEQRFRSAKVGAKQPVGRVGYGTFAGIFVIYILMLIFSGIL
ncbi:MAG TPA: hypothetical protein DD400_04705 [Rhodospirillaceae bacterium]|nr:hypothetical protein [Rhodospirillaceae bacterium]